MIGRLNPFRFIAVLIVIGGVAALGYFGIVGPRAVPVHFTQWQTIVTPAGADGVRRTEVMDIDWSNRPHHGPELFVPTDLGVPTEVTTSSPDAPADLNTTRQGDVVRFRIGDPNVSVTGEHRYTLAYVLPNAGIQSRRFQMDIINTLEYDIGSFVTIIDGFELTDPTCQMEPAYSDGSDAEPCPIERADDGSYRIELQDVAANTHMWVTAGITSVTPVEAAPLPAPTPIERPPANEVAAASAGIGIATATLTYLWARRRGRNEVSGLSPTDAAMPVDGGSSRKPTMTRKVTDAELAAMATTEFVPPRGIEPWQGAVLLDETFGEQTVIAYVSSLVGLEAITVSQAKKNLVISSGPKRRDLHHADENNVAWLLSAGDPFTTGSYNKQFADGWKHIQSDLQKRVAGSGWWRRGNPATSVPGGLAVFLLVVAGLAATAFLGWGRGFFRTLTTGAALGVVGSWGAMVILSVVAAGFAAILAFRVLLPSRTSTGSALALQTESFRRFLHASEGRHVQWAWEHGLLREYSAWAVALGEAKAWKSALERANISEPTRYTSPLLIGSYGHSFSSAHTAPSSSGGRGGFSSGGFSGGGGGGIGGGGW